jgi:hypothetical protein
MKQRTQRFSGRTCGQLTAGGIALYSAKAPSKDQIHQVGHLKNNITFTSRTATDPPSIRSRHIFHE